MLRDIPRIYFLMFGFMLIFVSLIYWYVAMFQRGSETTALNEAILSAAVSEADQSARMYQGEMLLANTFESTVWDVIEPLYPAGTVIEFDYYLDISHDRFDPTDSDKLSSPSYRIGGAEPSVSTASHMIGWPIKNVRVKVREKGDKVGDWTYVSTVTVDAASR